MRTYIFRRVALLPILLVAVSLLIFSLVRILPGDVALAKFGGEAPREMIDAVRRSLGLDRPIYEQYLSWVSGFVTGDFGTSLWTETPVLQEFLHALPVTLELTVLASVVAVLIGVSTGIISAVRQDTWLDHVARLGGIAGLAMPGFWLGTLFLLLPSLWLGWAPPLLYQSLLENPWDNLRQFIFPVIALGAYMAAVLMRITRSQMLEVLRQDYIRTAWAKGLRERRVMYRHALKNAAIPVFTVLGNQFGHLLGGTVIMESIFALPGVGRLTLNAVTHRDYPQIQVNVLFIATMFVLVNLVVDLMYAYFDPRIRYT